MVAVAQLVESRIVIPVVVGSSPISHPKEFAVKTTGYKRYRCSPFLFLEDEFQFLEDRCCSARACAGVPITITRSLRGVSAMFDSVLV